MRRMAVALALFAGASPALAQVSRSEVTEDAPAFAGRHFGEIGAYRRITARATVALDPADPHNAVIADLTAAPRNADGKVEAIADVVILTPADPAAASGASILAGNGHERHADRSAAQRARLSADRHYAF